MKILVELVLFVNTVGVVFAYPHGAPSTPEVCKTLKPEHELALPQNATLPYKISLDMDHAKVGQRINVTISGKKDETFKGFFCQVRNSSSNAIGKFIPDSSYQTGDCENLKANAATHVSNIPKKNITLNWEVPKDFKGEASVVCTVLESFDKYWTFVRPSGSGNITVT